LISRSKLKIIVPVVAVAAIGMSVVWVNQASGSATPPYLSYAVKFACGEFGKLIPAATSSVPEGPVQPGNYQTAINVHNPSASLAITFNKKAVLSYAGTKPVAQTQFEAQKVPRNDHAAELVADNGMLIDCQDIRAVLLKTPTFTPPAAPTFIEGWVIIQQPPGAAANQPPLDVTAMYTSHGYNCTPPAGSTACTSAGSRNGFSQQVVTVTPTQVAQ